jgi:hypothetical protein
MLTLPRMGSFTGLVFGVLLATPVPAAAQRILYNVSDGSNPVSAFLDLATGESTPVGSDFSGAATFTSDGQFVVRTVLVGTTTESRVRHVASGLELALAAAFRPQVAHPRQLAIFGTIDGVLSRLDPSGITTWTPCGAGVNATFQLSADGSRISVCPSGHFLVLDSVSGATLHARPPSHPFGLTGRLDPAATGYRLAIGSTPGSTNLGSITIGPATTFTATGVPPGRYFVRLHTVNYTGESPASSEIVVDVP